jgi:DNA-binding MarR family transcriptional regulator
MHIKLTDTQLVVLSAAAGREDRCLAVPENLKGNSAQKVASKLLAECLVREFKARPDMPVWRRDEKTERAYCLRLTAAGIKAIVADDADAQAMANAAPAEADPASIESNGLPLPETPNVPAWSPREGTKMARILGLLQRDQGATLADLIAATDWLPHTTRAALTGLRKRGYVVALDRSNKERGSTYSIPRDSNPASEKPTAPAIEPPAAPAARPAKASRSRKSEPVAADAAGPAA